MQHSLNAAQLPFPLSQNMAARSLMLPASIAGIASDDISYLNIVCLLVLMSTLHFHFAKKKEIVKS